MPGGAAEQFLSSEGTEERRAAGRGAGALSSRGGHLPAPPPPRCWPAGATERVRSPSHANATERTAPKT